jgi:hypothetical protein
MKAVAVLQKVQILPRAKASHQPGSKARWREETNVRSRVEQVSRVCMEPRKLFESRGPARDNHPPAPCAVGVGTADRLSALERRIRRVARGATGGRPPGS